MRVDCDIIRDLLPLYHDEVCSDKSRIAVEKHLVDCKNCNAELETMQADISLPTKAQSVEESLIIHKISKKWRRDILKSFLKGALITVLVIVGIALLLFLFVDFGLYQG